MDNLDSKDLRRVRHWGVGNDTELMALISPVFTCWGRLTKTKAKEFGGEWVTSYELATGGWSGCEEIINTLKYSHFWLAYWYSTTRGGLYIFHVPKPKAKE